MHKNTNLVNAKLAEHGVSPGVNPMAHRDNQEFYARMFCVMSPPTLADVAAAHGAVGES